MTAQPALWDDPPGSPGVVRQACQRTLTALNELGLIEGRHAGTAALLMSLADAIDQLHRYGGTRKGTPLALLARELREALATLPAPDAGINEGWEELARELRAAASARDAG